MRPIAVAAALAVALVVVYLALGGASYAPAEVADPCVPRDWREPEGLQEAAEQIVLSALDGAACELHVSREQVVLALATRDSRARFVREQGITSERLEAILRSRLLRAVDAAERANAIPPTIASIVRAVVRTVPVDAVLDLLERLPGG